MRSLVSAVPLALTFGVETALAQPAPPGQPVSAPQPAISKSCTDQANAKGLHGKKRKKFRSECKKASGKAQQ
jgi:psiF repeat-containing protein